MKKQKGLSGWMDKVRQDRQRRSTRDLLEIESIGEHGLQTRHGNVVFFMVASTNLSVLSDDSLTARIYALMTILKGQAEVEMMALNSRENFDANKRYIRGRLREETVPQIRRLLEKDLAHLDKIQVQTVTAREFLLAVRYRSEYSAETRSHLNQIEKIISEQSFSVKRAAEDDMKKLLGVYYEQNVTTERFEDFDGERWVVLGD